MKEIEKAIFRLETLKDIITDLEYKIKIIECEYDYNTHEWSTPKEVSEYERDKIQCLRDVIKELERIA